MKTGIKVCIALLVLGSGHAIAAPTAKSNQARLQVRVLDMQDAAVPNAVVSLQPEGNLTVPPLPQGATATMDQKNMAFVPQVMVVRVGTQVVFPNSDHIHHDIYSFSTAKQFDLNLRPGAKTRPVTFGTSGVVVMGCNIHDWMLGFIDVVATPYFGKSGASGRVVLRHLPAGRYQLRVWQPFMNGSARTQSLVMQPGETVSRDVKLSLHAPDRSNRPPAYLLKQLQSKNPHR